MGDLPKSKERAGEEEKRRCSPFRWTVTKMENWEERDEGTQGAPPLFSLLRCLSGP